jgi:predicted nucleic acid-binding protein
MMLYVDSSALVKKYVLESGSDRVLKLLAQSGMAVTSKLAYPEILAGLSRKRREKGIAEKDYRAALADFESDWLALLIIEFQDELLPLIKQLLTKHALKGADAVHLASALWIQKAAKEKVSLVASDIQLLRAAKSEKLEIINPEAG